MEMSVSPTVWVTDAFGLGRGSSSLGAFWASAAFAQSVARTRTARRSTRCLPGGFEGGRSIAGPASPSRSSPGDTGWATPWVWRPGPVSVRSAPPPEVDPADARLPRHLGAVRDPGASRRGRGAGRAEPSGGVQARGALVRWPAPVSYTHLRAHETPE